MQTDDAKNGHADDGKHQKTVFIPFRKIIQSSHTHKICIETHCRPHADIKNADKKGSDC